MSALELDSLKTELLHAIAEAADLDTLEEVRIAALGRKGRISELMQALALPAVAIRAPASARGCGPCARARRVAARLSSLARSAASAMA